MAYSEKICRAVSEFLREDGWNCEVDTEKELIRSGCNLKGKLQHVRIVVDLQETKYLTLTVMPLEADEACRPELLRLLNMINYRTLFGNFEMDEADGEVRFRFTVDCENMDPSKQVIKDSFVIPVLMFQRYGEAILAVMMGFGNAKDEYQKVQDAKK